MQALGLLLALILGLVEVALAVPLVLLPMKAAGAGEPGCARVLPPLALVPMALVNSGLFLFLRCQGTFLQKFGLCFGGTTIFAAALLFTTLRGSTLTGRPGVGYRLIVGAGCAAVFAMLFMLAGPNPGPVLSIDPGLAMLLAIIGFPAALVMIAFASKALRSFSYGHIDGSTDDEPKTGDVRYLPPPH